MDNLSDIEEVVRCGSSRANRYLAAGYKLLLVAAETFERKMSDADGTPYVQRSVVFALGKPHGVARLPDSESREYRGED